MSLRLRTSLAILLLPACFACGGDTGSGVSEPAQSPPPITNEVRSPTTPLAAAATTVEVPAEAASAEPNLHLGMSGTIYLTWLESRPLQRHRLQFSTWVEPRWSAARTIFEGDAILANWADFPAMAEFKDGTLLAHWLRKKAGQAYDIEYSTSQDQGATWAKPARLNDDDTASEHGFVSLVPRPDNTMVAVWLDGRDTTGHGGHDGDMSLRAAVVAVDGTVTTRSVLDPRVCDCCQTAAVALSDHRVVAFYRDRDADEIRDIAYLTLGSDLATTPIASINPDRWLMPGCPVNGPSARANGDHIAVAWYTEAGGEPSARFALSSDRGHSFSRFTTFAEGHTIGRVDLAWLDGNHLLLAWMDQTEIEATIRVREVGIGGALGGVIDVATTAPSRGSGFPRVISNQGTTLIAWTEAGTGPSIVRSAQLSR